MKKRLLRWNLDGSTLTATDIENEANKVSFDLEPLLNVLFKQTWEALPEAGRHAFAYAIKQKLMDTGAEAIGDAKGKLDAAVKRYEELKEGKWTGERVNATGVAEAKKVTAAVKAAAQVVSLEGLLMKKALAQLGGTTFTPEDEAKLHEFLEMAAKMAVKPTKK